MTNSHFDVVVVGNTGIDTNIYLPGKDIDFNTESNFTENMDCIGQAGGYSARGYARMGYKTAFIGFVGDDFQGRFIRDEFEKDGINTHALFIDQAGTSRSINFMYKDGRRKNFYDGKSHMNLSLDLPKCEKVLSGAKFAHFHLPNWARYLLPAAQKHNLRIASDLQDINDINDQYRQDFINASDILFFSSANHTEPETIIKYLLNEFPDKKIICGMGAEGCVYADRHQIQYFKPVQLPAAVIDTNGAGDSLAVGFLSSFWLEGLSVEESVLRGQIAARHTCSLKADSSNLVTREMLVKYQSELKNHYQ